MFNFIIPLFKQVPARYREEYFKTIPAKEMLNGLAEAFQPDFLVETNAGDAVSYGIAFDPNRTIPIDDLTARDERGRCKLGVDLRSVCADLYEKSFRFVQRHPPEVIIPSSKDPRYKLLFAAMFGSLPKSGTPSDVTDIYLKALDGKTKAIDPIEFPSLINQKYVYPLRVTSHELDTKRNSWSIDSKLFYMDERSSLDLIEFWNLRALGWDILPLPARLAPDLIEYCNKFIAASYRPYPPPSNAFHHASLLCARSQSVDALKEFISKLTWPAPQFASLDHRVPRIWEEWGRSADHAEPQTITHSSKTADAHIIGEGLHLMAELHDFSKDDRFCSQSIACANVLETMSGGTPVIPWKSNVAATLTHNFGEKKTWISREGIIVFAGAFSSFSFLRVPSPINIFSSLAESVGYKLSLSPAGRTCEQIISAVGGLRMIGIASRSAELVRFIDRLAHEDLEVEVENEDGSPGKRKKLYKPYAPLDHTLEVVRKSNPDHQSVSGPHLNALIRCNVLKLGMALRCTECLNTSWFSLENLSFKLPCPRCLAEFSFPEGSPPRDAWAYRVTGPFATGHYAHGAYCVANALHFLSEKIARQSSWIPSFEMRDSKGNAFEGDFGMLAAPSRFSHTSSPHLILGECKSFNRFEEKDFVRARVAAKLFPGAVLCFCTFNDSLNANEIRALKRIATEGRTRMDVGKQMNPVLILTARELFSEFRLVDFYSLYGDKSQHAQGVYLRDDIQELCEFTQQIYLGMESYHTYLEAKSRKIAARRTARKAASEQKA